MPGDQQLRWAVVGNGRVGNALVRSLGAAEGPFGRGFDGDGYDVVVLAVPDTQISNAASHILPGPLVGHCSGAVGLAALSPHECFGMHPLMTLTHRTASFVGAAAAVAGSSARALDTAKRLAREVGMQPFPIADEHRAAYHAAASIAANFLVTLEDAAESLLATAGPSREMLVPLVRAAVESWAAEGGPSALTGPIARGDDATVQKQRAAVAERTPELLALFDAMVERTAALARRR